MDNGSQLRGEITLLLEGVRQGRNHAQDELIVAVYHELRRTAARLLQKERAGHTLRATDLVHEAYLRLFGHEQLGWRDRHHFFASAARAMRRILIDHARRRRAGKRIPPEAQVPIELTAEPPVLPSVDVIAVDQVLTRLAEEDPRQAQVVELRYFAGLTVPEVAELLQVSRITVIREWRAARLWLHRELSR